MTELAFFQDLAMIMAVVGLVTVIFTRLKWPKVIGWLLAGIFMSQHTWGGSLLADAQSVTTLGQLGIVFLMFTLGLEISAAEMRKVRQVSVPIAVFDSVVMIWLGYTFGRDVFGWSSVQSLFLGAAICDSATTLLAKTIDEMGWRSRPFVKYIFGTTIFEDILCVGVIALVTGVANGAGMSVAAVGMSLGALLLFFVAVLVFGLILVPRLLNKVAEWKDDEAMLLVLLGCCFFVVYLAWVLDFSVALGAFLVGILGSSSMAREKLYHLSAPLRSMFSAVFFVTIGLLVDPVACWHNLPAILVLTLLIIGGKSFNCFFMSLVTGQKIKDAVQTAMGLAQIGEFAYMVALIYMTKTGDANSPMYQIVVGASLLSTCLNPLMLRLSDPVGDWAQRKMPERFIGVLSAYSSWLERFKRASMPSTLQRHLRSRLVWLAVIIALNFCVSFSAAALNGRDWSRFSTFFNEHKRFVFCLATNLWCATMLAPIASLARSLGRDVATVLVGVGKNRWRVAVHDFVSFAIMMAALALAVAQLIMINVNLHPEKLVDFLVILVVIVVSLVFGWNRFRLASRRASYHFNVALSAERRRAYNKKATPIQLSVPQDFYARIVLAANSTAVGETIKSLDVRARTGASIMAVERNGERFRNVAPSWEFAAGDVVSAIGEPPQIVALRQLLGIV